ncbi:hypothetical protein [uncultured Muribaculum sp.]|uniref:hypothetical protein n=1 Tax=uncultured Muribaculum sp. TaxID=1918613 RepID=UPI00272F0230|nr:hypothetical protein [uncultured Muribaculum sp.]
MPLNVNGICNAAPGKRNVCGNAHGVLTHTFLPWGPDNGRVARRPKETSNGAGVKNTELQKSKSRFSNAPAQAFCNSVFSPLSITGDAVCGRAASGKRRRRHRLHPAMPRQRRPAMPGRRASLEL